MSATAFRWSDATVRRALGLPGGDPERLYRDISTDTRTLGPGDVFVALEGARFDGHAFVREAVAAGCAAARCEREGTMANLAEAETWEAPGEIDPGTFSVIMGMYENIGREMMITLERSAWTLSLIHI